MDHTILISDGRSLCLSDSPLKELLWLSSFRITDADRDPPRRRPRSDTTLGDRGCFVPTLKFSQLLEDEIDFVSWICAGAGCEVTLGLGGIMGFGVFLMNHSSFSLLQALAGS